MSFNRIAATALLCCGLLLAFCVVPQAYAQQAQPGYLPPWQQQPAAQEPTPITPQAARPPATAQDPAAAGPAYGRPYETPRSGESYAGPGRDERYAPPEEDTYTTNEILDAGHRFFGTVSKGLANVVEYAFRRQGRPNGYILGEEAGGAFIAGLRYGEGTLYTKEFGAQKVYWQGPSIGYDFGGEGAKTLILVYNLRHPGEIFHRFAGVDGSAYFVGGAGITFQQHNGVILAPIRSGVGLRLGANVGYLKYTPYPTWNPF